MNAPAERKSPLGSDAFVASEPVEVKVPYNGKELSLFVREVGYSDYQMCLARASKDGNDNAMPYLIAESVADKDGNKFTIDEARRLKREIAEPLTLQILQFHGIGLKKEGEGSAEGGDSLPK